MRILVVSDTHNYYFAFLQAIESQLKANVIIHLGDGARDVEKVKKDYPQKLFLQVCGNCDGTSSISPTMEYILCGKKIFLTHGHLFDVKKDYQSIYYTAKQRGANILLFGHTHQAFQDYDEGLYILNPGTLSKETGSYGIIDITNQGITTNIIYMNKYKNMCSKREEKIL